MAYNSPRSMTLISKQTASSSSTISFTSLPTAYSTFRVILHNVFCSSANQSMAVVFSQNNGSTYLSSNYWWQTSNMYANSGSTGGIDNEGSNGATLSKIFPYSTSVTTNPINAQLNFYNIGVSQNCFYQGNCMHFDGNGNYDSLYCNGTNTTSGAVNALQFAMSSGNFSSGTFLIYGVNDFS